MKNKINLVLKIKNEFFWKMPQNENKKKINRDAKLTNVLPYFWQFEQKKKKNLAQSFAFFQEVKDNFVANCMTSSAQK